MTTKTVDLTPTWSEILPSLLILLKSESHTAQKLAQDELERMAKYADEWVVWQRQILRHRRGMNDYKKQVRRRQRKVAQGK